MDLEAMPLCSLQYMETGHAPSPQAEEQAVGLSLRPLLPPGLPGPGIQKSWSAWHGY